MIQIANNCVKNGAKYIGHIKSYLETKEGSLKADTIGAKYGVNVKSTISKPIKHAELVVNSVVQGIDKSQVKKATIDAIVQLLNVYGFKMKIEKIHEFFDEFDFPSKKNRGTLQSDMLMGLVDEQI